MHFEFDLFRWKFGYDINIQDLFREETHMLWIGPFYFEWCKGFDD